MFDADYLSAALRAKLQRTGLSLRVAAQECALSSATLSRILTKERAGIDMQTFARLIDWLNISPGECFPSAPREATLDSAWVDLFHAMTSLGVSSDMQNAIAQAIRVCFPYVTPVTPSDENQQ